MPPSCRVEINIGGTPHSFQRNQNSALNRDFELNTDFRTADSIKIRLILEQPSKD